MRKLIKVGGVMGGGGEFYHKRPAVGEDSSTEAGRGFA